MDNKKRGKNIYYKLHIILLLILINILLIFYFDNKMDYIYNLLFILYFIYIN